jgi:hypothetical protein
MPPRLQDGGFKIIYERNKHEKLEIVIANSVDYLTVQIVVSHYIDKNIFIDSII